MRSALACLAVMDLLKVQVLNSLVFLALGLPLPIVPASLGYLAASRFGLAEDEVLAAAAVAGAGCTRCVPRSLCNCREAAVANTVWTTSSGPIGASFYSI
ncbi:MAG: hypothetical protein WCL50_15440 [Spirochaetota bacterium]